MAVDQLMAGPLDGLRVVELSAFVAAPLGGATLARLGAEVIRVDPLGGGIDIGRWPLHEGRSLYWAGLNRGKRSVTLDLRSEAGREVAARLCISAGTVLTNLPGRPSLSYEDLSAGRADLVMVQIVGNVDGTAAVDYTVNAGTGFPWLTGPSDLEAPVNHVLPAWDVATGYLAAVELLAAERQRLVSGRGSLVTISLAEVALRVAEHLGYLDEARLVDESRRRYGNYVYGTFGRDFRTSDGGYVMVLALTPRQWRSLVEATGLPLDGVAPGLEDEGERWRNREAISAMLGAWIGERSLAEVGSLFRRREVLWGPYRTFKELVEQQDPGVSRLLNERPPNPVLGADTEAVLAELGEDVASLRATGVIG